MMTIGEVEVNYDGKQLIGNVEVTAAKHDIRVLGITLILTPDAASPKIYAMAVASYPTGISLPHSVATTTTETPVSGTMQIAAQIICAYTQSHDATLKTCQDVRMFSVSG